MYVSYISFNYLGFSNFLLQLGETAVAYGGGEDHMTNRWIGLASMFIEKI